MQVAFTPICDRIPPVPPACLARPGAATLSDAKAMLDSVSLPWQAVLWPLIGAAVILAASRFLPGWLCRLAAFVAAVASWTILWSLRTGAIEGVEIAWEPINLFRVSPTLQPDGLSLLVGMTLAGVVAAVALGSRGLEPPETAWYGLILVALAGCLLVTMASNLLALALGSGLLDLALIAMAASMPEKADRVAWRMAVPGIASTLVLVLSGVQMDTQVGTVSLLAQGLPMGALILMGVAGVLRLMIFPVHPRGLSTAKNATALIVAAGTGIYLLARVQAIAPVLNDRPWMLAAAVVALLAGGLWAWAGASGSAEHANQPLGSESTAGGRDPVWLGIAIHQTGLALVFVILLGAAVPWPAIGLALALAILAIWWGGSPEKAAAPRPKWLAWIAVRLRYWQAWAGSYLHLPSSLVERWRGSWLRRRGPALLPVVALASLAGAPLTAGALGRWPLYAILLRTGNAWILLAILVADTFLAAGLWAVFQRMLKQAAEYQPQPAATLAMLALALLLILVGSVSGALTNTLGLKPMAPRGVSAWGLGLIYGLPWLLGGWLTRVGSRVGRTLESGRRVVRLDWFFRVMDWVGQRFVGGLHWLGQVGEGDGWLGWALIILTLSAMFLITR